LGQLQIAKQAFDQERNARHHNRVLHKIAEPDPEVAVQIVKVDPEDQASRDDEDAEPSIVVEQEHLGIQTQQCEGCGQKAEID